MQLRATYMFEAKQPDNDSRKKSRRKKVNQTHARGDFKISPERVRVQLSICTNASMISLLREDCLLFKIGEMALLCLHLFQTNFLFTPQMYLVLCFCL